MLAEVWAQVLQLPRVGVQDNFFELGGHSLLATRVVAQIRENFQVDLPLTAMFEASVTVRTLAEAVDQLQRKNLGLSIPVLMARPPGVNRAPLSFTQERLWFLEQLEDLGGTYNEFMPLR